MGKLKSVIIDPNEIKVRDYLLMNLILGVTKSGIQKDQRKENNKRNCRKKISRGDYDS